MEPNNYQARQLKECITKKLKRGERRVRVCCCLPSLFCGWKHISSCIECYNLPGLFCGRKHISSCIECYRIGEGEERGGKVTLYGKIAMSKDVVAKKVQM